MNLQQNILTSRQDIPRRQTAPMPVGPAFDLISLGTTYSMAQTVAWVDENSFAIGRWDGTLTMFGLPSSATGNPSIETAAVSPSMTGVQMVCRIDDQRLASSNDDRSLLVYRVGASVNQPMVLTYDRRYGVANSGCALEIDEVTLVMTGHESGYLLVWRATKNSMVLQDAIDLRSPNPIPSPDLLRNIRAVVPWREDFVVTGSEDGDLCIVAPMTGEIVSRIRYDDDAQRGINDVAVSGDVAIVANCSVASEDPNLWSYSLGHGDWIERQSSVNLVLERAHAPVFNFAAELLRLNDATLFACATEEGQLWVGEVRLGEILVHAHVPVSSGLGAALAFHPQSGILAAIGDNVHTFRIKQK